MRAQEGQTQTGQNGRKHVSSSNSSIGYEEDERKTFDAADSERATLSWSGFDLTEVILTSISMSLVQATRQNSSTREDEKPKLERRGDKNHGIKADREDFEIRGRPDQGKRMTIEEMKRAKLCLLRSSALASLHRAEPQALINCYSIHLLRQLVPAPNASTLQPTCLNSSTQIHRVMHRPQPSESACPMSSSILGSKIPSR